MSRAKLIHSRYDKRFDRLLGARERAKLLADAGQIRVADSYLVYESAFINAVASFEGLLQEIFVEFACGDPPRKRKRGSKITIASRDTFRDILFDGKRYREFLPYKDRTLVLAKRFLRDGRPFTDITDTDRELLAHAMRIRNAIAHQSDFAMKEFRKKVPGVESMPPRNRFPGPLLSTVFRTNPKQTYFELYVITLKKVSRFLVEEW